jgi:hypothetical protein
MFLLIGRIIKKQQQKRPTNQVQLQIFEIYDYYLLH